MCKIKIVGTSLDSVTFNLRINIRIEDIDKVTLLTTSYPYSIAVQTTEYYTTFTNTVLEENGYLPMTLDENKYFLSQLFDNIKEVTTTDLSKLAGIGNKRN